MMDFRSRLWTLLFMAALLGPLAVVLVMMYVQGNFGREGVATTAAATGRAGGATTDAAGSSTRTGGTGLRSTTEPWVRPAPGPILLAGDGRNLWLVQPLLVDPPPSAPPGTDPSPGFRLMVRGANPKDRSTWTAARGRNLNEHFQGSPRLLTTVSPPLNRENAPPSSAYVLFGDDDLAAYSLENLEKPPRVPNQNRALAMTGAYDGVFVIARGSPTPPPRPMPVRSSLATAPATRSGTEPSAGATTSAATDTGPRIIPPSPSTVTEPSTQPATVNAYWYHNGLWDQLPSMGEADAGSPQVPSEQASVVLGHVAARDPHPSRLVALWVEPDAPATLVARAINYRGDNRTWTEPVITQLPMAAPRLLITGIEGQIFLYWPTTVTMAATAPATGAATTTAASTATATAPASQLALIGGPLLSQPGAADDLTLPPERLANRDPLVLSHITEPEAFDVQRDLGIGTTGNSVAVVTRSSDNKFTMGVFSERGDVIASPAPIDTRDPRASIVMIQNMAYIVLFTLLVLSMWQWRQRPAVIVLPPELRVARLYKRAGAFGIDMAAAVIASAIVLGVYDPNEWRRIFSAWVNGFFNMEAFFDAPELVSIIATYIIHVTISEAILGRSMGKMALGLRVIMLDGRPPTLFAILVRNIVRVPELLTGVLLIYVLLSNERQRLGDLLGRTLVAAPRGPDDEDEPEIKEE